MSYSHYFKSQKVSADPTALGSTVASAPQIELKVKKHKHRARNFSGIVRTHQNPLIRNESARGVTPMRFPSAKQEITSF